MTDSTEEELKILDAACAWYDAEDYGVDVTPSLDELREAVWRYRRSVPDDPGDVALEFRRHSARRQRRREEIGKLTEGEELFYAEALEDAWDRMTVAEREEAEDDFRRSRSLAPGKSPG